MSAEEVTPTAGQTATSVRGAVLRVGDWLAYDGRLVRIVELTGSHPNSVGRLVKTARLHKPLVGGGSNLQIRPGNLYWRVNR